MNFVLIINIASYKVFPLAVAMISRDNDSSGEVSSRFWLQVYAFKT
jgi:hypothetical protein